MFSYQTSNVDEWAADQSPVLHTASRMTYEVAWFIIFLHRPTWKCDKVQTSDQGIKESKLYSETNEITEILAVIRFW